MTGQAGGLVSTPREFWTGSSGRWAGERLLAALEQGRGLSASELRVAGTLRSYEWVQFDNVVLEEVVIRLRGVADLITRGLVKNVPNGLGRTVLQYEKSALLQPAVTSLDGIGESGGDRTEFEVDQLPLPITHKDFYLNLRTLMASRNPMMGGNLGGGSQPNTVGGGSEPLDTMQARLAGRAVAEQIEYMLFNGGPQFGNLPIYGYLTEPNRNHGSFVGDAADRPWSSATKTGAGILQDTLVAIAALQAARFFGPYAIYVPTNTAVALEADFKSFGTISIRERLLEVDQVVSVLTCDQLPADTIVFAQLTEDVVCLVEGEPPQTIQWDVEGGLRINFKAMAIQVPLVRSTKAKRSGVYHMAVGQ